MARVTPARRPHYSPQERMAILELRAARGWSWEQTARRFQVTEPTIASWLTRLEEQGPAALVRTPVPVNKFPQFVGYLVRRFKILCPELGKRKLAAMLARAGLHLGATTVARLWKAIPAQPTGTEQAPHDQAPRSIVARQPHDVWHVDLTVVPTGGGFWVPWLPWSLPQRLPFGWWVAAIVDGYSRKVLGLRCFADQPSSYLIQTFLARTMHDVGARPRNLITDRGRQFDCREFRSWCRRRKIRVRYGAVGRHGSIAVVERFIRTLKEYLRTLPVVPLEHQAMTRELRLFGEWFNEHRPHKTLGGRTPQEVDESRFPAYRRPRYEPRSQWPRGSRCARPWALIRGRPGARLELDVAYHGGRRHLPIVCLRRVG